MILILILAGLSIISIVCMYILRDHEEEIILPFFVLLLLNATFLIALGSVAAFRHVPLFNSNEKIRYTEKYNTIIYVAEHDARNIYLLGEDISEYNAHVIQGRNLLHNPFTSWLQYSFWDDLELIDYETLVSEQSDDRND